MTKKEDRNLKLNIWLIFPFMHLCVKKKPLNKQGVYDFNLNRTFMLIHTTDWKTSANLAYQQSYDLLRFL